MSTLEPFLFVIGQILVYLALPSLKSLKPWLFPTAKAPPQRAERRETRAAPTSGESEPEDTKRARIGLPIAKSNALRPSNHRVASCNAETSFSIYLY